ncbi:DUF3159 domain-containing protein [Isoptericola chiayiensis]|uniref:DUF3159 domain-containing protein n=1 Tax=Isoptericola chiayiensis TaxID=579446 RepID=A0ABP8YF34_9MICO|nr:DUF3159 domain-containing protein [Isoptericola chiayiensis]NOW00154.1 hypothetical protein [Isoptericola chiayiensis]
MAEDPLDARRHEQTADGEPAARGMRAVTGETFSFAAAVGGVRGVVEAILPGLVFVVVFVVTEDLTWSLVSSCAAALVAVVARLVQRTPVTQALGGVLGIAVGVVWAWRTGAAEDFYAVGLWTNAAYLLAFLVSIAVRWPLVGLFVEAVRTGFSDLSGGARTEDERDDDEASAGSEPSPWAAMVAWRQDPDLVRRYLIASWFWVGLFAIRLAVKVPLYLAGDVGWLGTMHLVLGVPLWGLVLWLTWVVVRGAHRPEPAPTA